MLLLISVVKQRNWVARPSQRSPDPPNGGPGPPAFGTPSYLLTTFTISRGSPALRATLAVSRLTEPHRERACCPASHHAVISSVHRTSANMIQFVEEKLTVSGIRRRMMRQKRDKSTGMQKRGGGLLLLALAGVLLAAPAADAEAVGMVDAVLTPHCTLHPQT